MPLILLLSLTQIGILPGECGSVVVDQETFEIYGHIIGSDGLGHAYVVPLRQTFDQIKTSFGAQNVSIPQSACAFAEKEEASSMDLAVEETNMQPDVESDQSDFKPAKDEGHNVLKCLTPMDLDSQHGDSLGRRQALSRCSEQYKIRRDIIQALQTSPYLERKDRNPGRVEGTCGWFMDHDNFKQWRQSESSSLLWLTASPGSGKSVLAKSLADELTTTSSRTTCYFFFKDDFEDQRSAKSALSCLLHQLFMQRKILLSDNISKRLQANTGNLTSPINELWDTLVMASRDKNAGEVVCILDALDECEEKERRQLSNALRKFYDTDNNTRSNVNLKFLITSRPYYNVERYFQPLNIPGLPIIHLKGDSDVESARIAQEINIYIEDRVSHIRQSLRLNSAEENFY